MIDSNKIVQNILGKKNKNSRLNQSDDNSNESKFNKKVDILKKWRYTEKDQKEKLKEFKKIEKEIYDKFTDGESIKNLAKHYELTDRLIKNIINKQSSEKEFKY